MSRLVSGAVASRADEDIHLQSLWINICRAHKSHAAAHNTGDYLRITDNTLEMNANHVPFTPHHLLFLPSVLLLCNFCWYSQLSNPNPGVFSIWTILTFSAVESLWWAATAQHGGGFRDERWLKASLIYDITSSIRLRVWWSTRVRFGLWHCVTSDTLSGYLCSVLRRKECTFRVTSWSLDIMWM